jgi:helicase MOV-10
MMERIMKLDSYKFDKKSGYDKNFIVQLTDNFRSHKSLIEFSNEEFYNSQLVSRQKEAIANFAIGWQLLPNKNYPVIFQANWTESKAIEGSTSLINSGELFLVRKYANALLNEGINGKKVKPKDIGIISPYAAQRENLKKVFTNGIEIGSVEYFQGREKLIIILTCVRSKTKNVGFLSNPKRINVALTRAKALLIVIGNPETLAQNQLWRKFITLCHMNNAVIGKIPNWVVLKAKKELKIGEDDCHRSIGEEKKMPDVEFDD